MKKNMLILLCLLCMMGAVKAQPCNDGCELIGNGNFTSFTVSGTTYATDQYYPFSNNWISCWRSSHGSAHLPVTGTGCTVSPDPCYADYAFMWFSGYFNQGEGIYQAQNIQAGHKYFYSYDLKFDDSQGATETSMDHFWVKFINPTSTFFTYSGLGGAPIPVPASQQLLEHHTNIVDTTFQNKCAAVTANNNYQGLWMYPQENVGNDLSGVGVTNVHLYEATAGPDITICSGSSAVLGNSVCTAPIPGATYSWSPSTGLSSTTSSHPTVTLTNTGPFPVGYMYIMSVTLCGQTHMDTVVVSVTPNIFAGWSITGDNYLCTGETANFSVPSGYTYSWSATAPSTISSPASYNTNISFSTPGVKTVSVVVTDPVTGCSRTITYTVNVYPAPVAPIVSGGTIYGCSGTYNYSIDNFVAPPHVYTVTVSGGTLAYGPDAMGHFMITWTGTAGSYTITSAAPSPYSCSASATFNVLACCSDPSSWVNCMPGFTDSASELILLNGGPTVTSQQLTVNGTLVIDQDITFNSCTLKMGDNAKIVVQTGKIITFNSSTLTICTLPWDGIYVSSPTSNVIMNSSLAEHARNAIVSQTGGRYTVNGSGFKDNGIGIDVQAYSASHTGTVVSSLFYTSAPIITGTPFTGIRLNNVYNIVIGDPAYITVNGFRNLNYGIATAASNYRIYHNRFVDIPGSSPYVMTSNAGIYTLGYNSTAVTPNALISRNTLTNNENGILQAFSSNTQVLNNDFYTIPGYGYYSYDPANFTTPSQILADKNDLTDVKKGFYFLETSITNSAGLTVSNNSINNTDLGIYMKAFRRPKATTNCITLNEPVGSAWSYGIQAQNCYSFDALLNTVKGTNTGTATAGIQSEVSQVTKMENNYITGCFLSLVTLGDCSASTLRCNNMYNYLGAGYYMLGGLIGPQGSSSTSYFNKWFSGSSKLLVHSANGTLSPFYVRSVAPYLVGPGESNLLPPGTAIPVTVGAYPGADGCSNLYPSLPCAAHLVDGGSDGGGDDEKEKAMLLFNWNMNKEIPKNPSEDYLEKEAMYQLYLEHPEYFAGTGNTGLLPLIDGEMMSVANEWNALQNMVQWPALDAGLQGEGISAGTYSNPMTDLQHRVNQVVKNAAQRERPYTFSTGEVNMLEEIAALCPLTNGRAVYAARTILQPMTGKTYSNACEQPLLEKIMEAGAGTWSNVEVNVYPNPADGTLNVAVPMVHEHDLTVALLDMNGKKVQEKTIVAGSNMAVFNTAVLNNGVYSIRILQGGVLVHLQKAVVVH